MEKHITEYSEKEFIALVKEFEKLPTYLEKVHFIYQKWGVVMGEECRAIKNKEYSLSLKPTTPEDNLQRWEYYLEQKARESYKQWIEINLRSLDKAPNKADAINKHIEKIKGIISKDPNAKRGYDYAITRSGLEWVNSGHLSFNCGTELNQWAKGLGIYYVEVELIKMLEKAEDEDSILNVKTEFTLGYRLVLLEQLGIIDHLVQRYNIVNEPVKIVKLFAEILGVDISNGKNRSFVANVNHLIRHNHDQGPSNNTSRGKVEGFLHSIRLTRSDSPPVKNSKKRS